MNIDPVKKRRRKVMKSCHFCRKRKLKCDHGKPKCQQCSSRGIECIYSNGFNFDVTMEDLLGNIPIRSKIPLDTSNKDSNNHKKEYREDNLLKFQFFDSNKGQYQIYGPTSWKAIIDVHKNTLETEYMNLWNFQKNKYNERKPETHLSDKEVKYWIHFEDAHSVIEIICNTLPTYEKTRDTIDKFFSSTLHDIYRIVDHQQILDAFNESFLISGTDPSYEGLLNDVFTNIHIPSDGNLYPIGIILLIITYTTPNFTPDKSLTSFLEQLAFSPSFSVYYIERPQFLLLMYLFKASQLDAPIWEIDRNNNLIMSICQSCKLLGMDRIDKWKNMNNYSNGMVHALKNTVYWTIFFDVNVSFEQGQTLCLSDELFDYTELYKLDTNAPETCDHSKSKENMTAFLKLVRPIVDDLNSTKFKNRAYLDDYIKVLTVFLDSGSLSINSPTELIESLPAHIYDLPMILLGGTILLALYHMKNKYFGENSIDVNNGVIKYSIMMLNFSCQMVQRAHKMDSFKGTHCHITDESISSHLYLSISITAPVIKRVILEFHDYFLQNISSSSHLYDDISFTNSDIPLHNFYLDKTHAYPLTPALQQFESITKSLWDHADGKLNERLGNSTAFTTIYALQTLSHLFALQKLKLIKLSGESKDSEKKRIDFCNTYSGISRNLWEINAFDLVRNELSQNIENVNAESETSETDTNS